MKLKYLFGSMIAGACLLAAGNVRAGLIENVTISLTTYTQNTNHNDGTFTTIAPIKVKTRTTADLLKTIAKDENLLGNWPSNTFPAGAKLAFVDNQGLCVVSGTNILVSGDNLGALFTFDDGGFGYSIETGKTINTNGLAKPSLKSLQVSKVSFDDSAVPGQDNWIKFYMQGLVTSTVSDSLPNANGIYTTVRNAKLASGVGEGTSADGSIFVLTGTITASGHGTLPVPTPPN